MIVGGGLLIIGLLLPIFWPRHRTRIKTPKQATFNESMKQTSSFSSNNSSSKPKKSSNPISLKVRRLSMQSTYGEQAVNFLKALLESESNQGLTSPTLSTKLGIDQEQTKKTANLLLNLGLIQKNNRLISEEYFIPAHLRDKVFSAIYED